MSSPATPSAWAPFWPLSVRKIANPGLLEGYNRSTGPQNGKFVLALLFLACSNVPIQSASTEAAPPTTTLAVTTTTARVCRSEPRETIFTGTDPVKLSIALTTATLNCADEVVVASGEPFELIVAARLAAARKAPLLVTDETDNALESELRRLAPEAVTVVGDLLPSGVPAGTATTSLSISEARASAGTSPPRETSDSAPLWLADSTRRDLAAPVIAIAAQRDEEVMFADPAELRTDPDLLDAVRASSPERLFVAGGFDPSTVEWEANALATAPELPGGGLTLFPGRRLVALYGNPTTSALGVLGEQGPEDAVPRAQEISAGYEADGTPITLAFEIIATVASAGATADGNYSEEMSLEVLQPWVDVAAANDLYVILDLQPGRTDFLTQAKMYEEFLRLPHVGLALDPEWRLLPDQVHLRQIGSVDAAEVNQVGEWLAAVVRENNLPQKFFLLHQFRLDMIPNRELVEVRPELATVIQMDGQGPLSTKYDTWNALTTGTEGNGIYWGWKNFYDEDVPRGGATPAEVLTLDPVPVYISYQ